MKLLFRNFVRVVELSIKHKCLFEYYTLNLSALVKEWRKNIAQFNS